MPVPPFELLLHDNPTLDLLRANQAPLILGFLWHAFREKSEVTRSQAWMQQHLADWIEQQTPPSAQDEDFEGLARGYLNKWCERKFLRNFMDDQRKEIQYVLTRHTEKAFQVIELLQTREFVSTESRFQDIFAKLREIAREGQQDTQASIRELEAQREQLDARILQLQKGGRGAGLEDYQIRSRYEDVLRLLHELRGDFREVEDNFRQLTRDIYARHAEGKYSSGRILGDTFDALDELRGSDQGKSFYTFWRFLNDEALNEELQRLIAGVHTILSANQLAYADKDLRYLKRTLYSAGYQVVISNEQLSQKLAQIVAEQEVSSRQRTLELTRAIRQQTLALIGQEPETGVSLAIEMLPELYLPLERPLQLKQSQPAFVVQSVRLGPDSIALDEIETFYNPWLVDRQLLLRHLQQALHTQAQISLPELLARHPLEKGLAELLAWISLSQSEPHLFDWQRADALAFNANPPRSLTLPHLIFVKEVP